jgi:hypothetical protein
MQGFLPHEGCQYFSPQHTRYLTPLVTLTRGRSEDSTTTHELKWVLLLTAHKLSETWLKKGTNPHRCIGEHDFGSSYSFVQHYVPVKGHPKENDFSGQRKKKKTGNSMYGI